MRGLRGEQVGDRDVAQRGDARHRDLLGQPLGQVRGRSRRSAASGAPLCTAALWNSPAAAGITQSSDTAAAPADSPKIVTLAGSPPNAAMLSCTQRSASTQSRRPQFAEGSPSGASDGWARKPSAPSR